VEHARQMTCDEQRHCVWTESLTYSTADFLQGGPFQRFRICTGKRSPAVPATPGCVRIRTRRFGELSLVRCSQTGDAERAEIDIWHSEAEGRTVSDSPWAIWAARRLGKKSSDVSNQETQISRSTKFFGSNPLS